MSAEPAPVASTPASVTRRAGVAYGAFGLPLAFAALPLYVLLPAHHAQAYGVPLGALGALLLAVRAFDALVDPALGRWADRLLGAGGRVAWGWLGAAALLLVLGFTALFFPPVRGLDALLAWTAAGLIATSLAYSLAGILHQAWGARLGGGDVAQARWSAWREGSALLGVMVASVLPSVAGLGWTCAVLAVAMALAWALLARAPRPAAAPFGRSVEPPAASPAALTAPSHTSTSTPTDVWHPWRQPAFRRLIATYLLNGIGSAVPATLVLFFVRDRLQAQAWEGAFLAAYFAAGALSLPLWVRVIAAIGLVRSWAAGMLLAVVTFIGAATLQAGDGGAFLVVCLASGLALGADLAVPGALLAAVVRGSGAAGRLEGAYFGWWNAATKLNLALSAGLALPLLGWAGYRPGSADPAGLAALGVAYALLPCALKLLAAAALWRFAPVLREAPGEMSRPAPDSASDPAPGPAPGARTHSPSGDLP